MHRMNRFALLLALAGLSFADTVTLAQNPVEIDIPGVRVNVGSKKTDKRKPSEPKPDAKPVIVTTFDVTGDFQSTKEAAKASALALVPAKVKEFLNRQNPPVDVEPSPEMLLRIVLPDEKYKEEIVVLESSGAKYTQYTATVTVQLQSDHVRELRGRERAADVLSYLGVGAVIFLSLAAFFRIDVMTRGYLTTWLMLAASFVAMFAIFWWGMAWKW
jgi:hypothetical protein